MKAAFLGDAYGICLGTGSGYGNRHHFVCRRGGEILNGSEFFRAINSYRSNARFFVRESAILKNNRGNTMDWIKRLNQAIDFIERNLDGELDYEEVAGIAGCPSYYFQQMFFIYDRHDTAGIHTAAQAVSVRRGTAKREMGK